MTMDDPRMTDNLAAPGDSCPFCSRGHIFERVETNVRVGIVPGHEAIILPKARVGRCDRCPGVMYVIKVEEEQG